MLCPLCKYQTGNRRFFSRHLCLRYRPIINPGGQGHVVLNRCFTPRPLFLLFRSSHSLLFYLCSPLNPPEGRVHYLCLPWEDASGCLVPRQAFTCGSSRVPLHCLFLTGPLSVWSKILPQDLCTCHPPSSPHPYLGPSVFCHSHGWPRLIFQVSFHTSLFKKAVREDLVSRRPPGQLFTPTSLLNTSSMQA